MCSASSIARLIEATVASMLTTTPFLSPFDGCEPIPITSMPSSVISPTMAQILVVPMSRPTRMSPLFAMSPPPGELAQSRFAHLRALSDPLPPPLRHGGSRSPAPALHLLRRRQPDRHPGRVD